MLEVHGRRVAWLIQAFHRQKNDPLTRISPKLHPRLAFIAHAQSLVRLDQLTFACYVSWQTQSTLFDVSVVISQIDISFDSFNGE
jgi:hypothetical protein